MVLIRILLESGVSIFVGNVIVFCGGGKGGQLQKATKSKSRGTRWPVTKKNL